MPLSAFERFGGKLFVWTFALAVVLALVGLIVATSESLRRQEHTVPFTEAVEPDLPLQNPQPPEPYRTPGATGWPTP